MGRWTCTGREGETEREKDAAADGHALRAPCGRKTERAQQTVQRGLLECDLKETRGEEGFILFCVISSRNTEQALILPA